MKPLFLLAALTAAISAQEPERARLIGRVTVAETGSPVPGALVTLDGTTFRTRTDSAGAWELRNVPPGPHMLVVRRIGLAPARVPVVVPVRGTLRQDVTLAVTALEMPDITITAEPAGRARGELGTASVLDREAIANQNATSLRGVLELLPGVASAPPGLEGVQQVGLRSVPTNQTASFTAGGPSAADLASFGTLIILDGVPVSNNANLQTTGPRGELDFLLQSSAGGGVDLRRIPASTIERVEAIRGIPSARYGDLTQGVIVVDTRAGAAAPEVSARLDERTVEGSAVGGRRLAESHAVTATVDAAHTRLRPGLTAEDATRISAQLSHRLRLGAPDTPAQPALDTRIDVFRLSADNPERPEVFPGRASASDELGIRVSERLRLGMGSRGAFTVVASADYGRSRSSVQALRLRSALPFTDRAEEGRATGRYVLGEYLSELAIDGDAWQLFSRIEADQMFGAFGADHRLLFGAELRREWNSGAGFQFDIERPPQVTFNGVQGFDRPRRFDVIPPAATSALYVDDRIVRAFGGLTATVQAGLRADVLHGGATWFSGVRDAVLQPRLNAEVAPISWLRLRAGIGRTAKVPGVGSLFPAPQFFDVVNVNWFTNDPAERLAVLTTFVRDPANPDLGFAVGNKREAGFQVVTGRRGLTLDFVIFRDGTRGGVGFRSDPGFLVRDLYDFVDSTTGTGRPPTLIEPPTRADTVPILLDVPANVLDLENRGIEATVQLPQVRPLRLRLHVQGAWVRTEFADEGLDFGSVFGNFQVNGSDPRSPYWEGVTRRSERLLLTYRLVHHRPDLGLVITALVEHIAKDVTEDSAGTDTLSWAGYITRAGELVPVPPARRGDPEFADLRVARGGSFARQQTPADWFLTLQVSKTLPLDGRLSFYAFNVLDRQGRIASAVETRTFPRLRFGLELTMPLGPLFGYGEGIR